MIGSKLLIIITTTTKTLTCAKNMFHVSQLAETLQQPSEVSLLVWRLQRSNWGPGSSGSLLTVTQTGGSRAGIRRQAGGLRAQALNQCRVFWRQVGQWHTIQNVRGGRPEAGEAIRRNCSQQPEIKQQKQMTRGTREVFSVWSDLSSLTGCSLCKTELN